MMSGEKLMAIFRRVVAAAAAIVLASMPCVAAAQQIRTVGVLAPHDFYQREYAAFTEMLKSLGHGPANLRLLYRSAQGKADRLASLAAELVDAQVDVIVGVNTPGAGAAIKATKTIPIVMTVVGDPLTMGFVSNLARPGGNVTGISNINRELAAKRLALLQEAVPSAKKVAALFNPNDPINALHMEDMKRAAPGRNVELRFFAVKEAADVPEAFRLITAWHAHAAMWLTGGTQGFQKASAELAVKHRLPVMARERPDVEAGALMSYSADTVDLFRRTAVYVDRVLKGMKPGDLPVEQPTKFDLVVNVVAARAVGINLPGSLLLQADRVVE
jgi:putative ABC transport system substrate-binding protein